MSETNFKEAQRNLAYSQKLVDEHRMSQVAQMSPGQPQEAPQQPEMAPQQEETVEPSQEPQTQESSSEAQNSPGMLSAFMDEIRALFKAKEDEEKKTQELIDNQNKDMSDIKQGLTELNHSEGSQ